MISKQLFLWFLVNALLPMIIPALFLAVVAWFGDGSFPFGEQFVILLNSGFYIFSASALVFSLYEEYGVFKQCVGPLMQIGLVLLLIATLGMFYQIQNESADYIKGHLSQFYIIWGMTALFAGIIKYKIIKYKLA